MGWNWKKITEGGLSEIRSQIVSAGISIISPFIAAAAVFVTGLIQLPVAYALTATGVMFAAASFGAYYFYNLFFQRSPEAKLVPLAPQAMVQANPDDMLPNQLQLGMMLQNNATFPIEYKVRDLTVIAASRVNPDAKIENLHAVVFPNTIGALMADPIDIRDFKYPHMLECKIRAVIDYGRPGDLKFEMTKAFKLNISVKGGPLTAGEQHQTQWFHAD